MAPHDIRVREFGSGLTRLDKARNLGVKFTVAPSLSVVDGIEAVRSTLGKVWIDSKSCAVLVRCLENYRQQYDSKRKVYRSSPLHDWSSHSADAMRYLCISLSRMRDGLSAEDLDRRYAEAVYGIQTDLPPIFRDDYGGRGW